MSTKVRITLHVGETGEYYYGRNAYRVLDNIYRNTNGALPVEVRKLPRWKRAAYIADHTLNGNGTMQLNIWREPRRANSKRSAFVKTNVRNGDGKRLLTKPEVEARNLRMRQIERRARQAAPRLELRMPLLRAPRPIDELWREMDMDLG